MQQLIRPTKLLLIFSFWALFFTAPPTSANPTQSPLSQLITDGGFVMTIDGKTTAEYNGNTTFIPASTLKLATSLVALKILGPTHRFTTEFYLQEETKLFIKGYGDPFLTSEYVADIVSELKKCGIRRVDEIIIDDFSFSLLTSADGSENSINPYDAENRGVAVNFNAIPLVKSQHNQIVSGESQTPLLPLMNEIGRNLKQGRYRLNVSAFQNINKTDNSLRYTAELFAAILNRQGIKTGNLFRRGKVNQNAKLVYSHQSSRVLSDLVKDCLKYSNNFIANQLLLSCGAKLYGYPATWEKGVMSMRQTLIKHFEIPLDNNTFSEGSGLSRRNRVTPQFLISILDAFKPYADLLEKKDTVLVKSGTLSGVYCLAGYFTRDRAKDPFVILLNQKKNNRNQVLTELHRKYLAEIQLSSTQPKFKTGKR